MKKTVQSDAKREIVMPEQHEPQDQVEQQPSQASDAMKTPEVSEPALESNTSETSQEVHGTEAANEAPGEHDAEDVAAVQDVEAPKVTRARRRKRKIEALSEEEITPRPSYWPIVLACALTVMLLGTTLHPIVLAVGALLVIGCIIGWSLERR